jgi:hypothetical protein
MVFSKSLTDSLSLKRRNRLADFDFGDGRFQAVADG